MSRVPALAGTKRDARSAQVRFVLGFVVGAILFELAFVSWIDGSPPFEGYLRATAWASQRLLGALGIAAAADGNVLWLEGHGHIELLRGCDGLESVGLFLLAVFLYPAPRRAQIRCGLAGTLLIVAVNLVRVASLALALVHRPSLFEPLHLVVWPLIFILGPLALWHAWSSRH